ncbi:MAG: hypothetical protein ACYTF6_11945 [Planctomycetota bacterium]|jgi:hypothetical protein
MSDKLSKALNEMTPEELIAYFGNTPVPWACHGVGMLRSAFVVWRVFSERSKQRYQHAKAGHNITPADMVDRSTDHFVHAYRLLAATAMENLAKGLFIAKGKLVIKNHRLPGRFLTHDIVRFLSEDVGFKLNDEERRTLTECTEAVIWQTRYPMPTDAARLPREWPGNEFGEQYNHPVDFRDLAERILRDYSDGPFQGAFVSTAGLIQILDLECPEPEALDS